VILAIVFLVVGMSSFPDDTTIQKAIYYREQTIKATRNSERTHYNNKFINYFERIISGDTSMSLPYKEYFKIVDIRSEDGRVRILHWNLPVEGDYMQYFGYVVLREEPKRHKIIKLKMCLKESDVLQRGIYGVDCWPGALYYYMRKLKTRGDTTYYLLLGWDGYGPLSDRKIVELMCIVGDRVTWGSPLFRDTTATYTRLVFEYYEGAAFTLRWDSLVNGIVFQELESPAPFLKDIKYYYVPSSDYGSITFDGDYLKINYGVDVRNPPERHRKGVRATHRKRVK